MSATILCVEDEADLRADICEELVAAGYQVDEAGNGQEALERLKARSYDLVLCDITMPRMSGLDLLRLVRQEPGLAELPFIFLTALAGRRDIIAGKEAGVDDYLTKPIDFDLMLITIAARLDQVARIKGAKPQQSESDSHSLRAALLGADEALNRISIGVFLLDAERKVLFRNQRAEELLAEADGLTLSREGLLRGEKPQQTQALRDIIDLAISRVAAGNRQGSDAVALTRDSGRRPLIAVACPLGRGPAGAGEPAVGLFVTDPEWRSSDAAHAVAQLYGLSPAETRLALALVRGLRLDEIADEFGLSRNTVSYTLKNLFRKTETDRQADLISLFMSNPVALGKS
ncbi:MAG TPA: response regulator [Devosia sp.]|jgi:DNA-binding response OmpR family regulator/DNA-binding CsgD family transcriptional regulator|uniref:response regulator n=1 Tax=Devosia sp. TaxID=1871048 RepID=UPI002F936BDA